MLLVLLLCGPAHARVKLGIEVLLEKRIDLVAGKRVGLITNDSAVDGDLVTTLDRLRTDKRVTLVQLYSPEHGLRGTEANGQSDGHGKDGDTRLPVEGLLGNGPSARSLKRLDVLIFDIQDIGSRTYTYVSTLGLAMQSARRAGVRFIVLDRPNPQGGLVFEGPIRKPRFKSFIGWGPLPVTHGMTVGEVARFYAQEVVTGIDLVIVPVEGWRRSMTWAETGLVWIPTSPGIPHDLNAHTYVATGMVGGAGTNMNEGIGTAQPFELMGAPFVEPRKLAVALTKAALPGIRWRPLSYRPKSGRYEDKVCGGVQLILDDPRAFRPLRTALTLLVTLKKLYPKDFKVQKPGLFGLVWGDLAVLQQLQAGKSAADIEASWAAPLGVFKAKRAKVLIYE